MPSYKFLKDILVLEVAWLGPDGLGGLLADMGATVIKIENPASGDLVRHTGLRAVGSEDGPGFMHLRWNRGKKSVGIDLKTPEGIELFKRFARKVDVIIDGMRGGTLDRMGLGYEVLRADNPKLVFCSLSGLGRSGPYANQASNAPGFDLFAGLTTPPRDAEEISKHKGPQPAHIAMCSMGLYAAVGVLAAIVQAQRTGEGSEIEVAAADTAAHWITDALEPILNEKTSFERRGWVDKDGRMSKWSRLDLYAAKDGRLIYIQFYYEKFWERFLEVTDRQDLAELYGTLAPEDVDEALAARLTELFKSRTYDEWATLFFEEQIPFLPANTFEDLTKDPHFLARDNLYTIEGPDGVSLTLTSTPIKVSGQSFSPSLAPELGEHTDEILRGILQIPASEIDNLRATKAIS